MPVVPWGWKIKNKFFFFEDFRNGIFLQQGKKSILKFKSKKFFKRKNYIIPLIIYMATHKKILVIILSLAVLSSSGLACYGYNKLDRVKAENVVLKRTDIKDQDTCYSILIDFDMPTSGFQTALSISNFNSLKTFQGYDYNIRGANRKGTNYLSISVLVSERNQWTVLSVSYLVTARNDIFAGSFLADAYNQFDCNTRSNRDLFFNALVPTVQSGFQYEAKVFISGIKCRDPSINFKFKNSVYNVQTQTLQIQAASDAFPFIEYIQISYVIYRATPQFNIAFVPISSLKQFDYSMAYTHCFTKSEPQFYALAIITDRLKCVGRGCKNECYNTQQCLAAGGQKYGRSCYICGRYERLENWQCVPNCNFETEEFNPVANQCSCKPGFSRIAPNEPCRYICGVNEIWNGRCICKPGFGRFSGNCGPCPQYSTSNPAEQCVCDNGYYWNLRKLICEANFCPANSVPYEVNPNEWSCKCSLPNQYYNQFRKVCEFVAECPPNSKLELIERGSSYKEWGCSCNPGFYFNTKTRTCDFLAACGEYAYPNFNGNEWVCICKNDCYAVGKSCKPIPACPPNSKFNVISQQCECVINGERMHNGICRPCGKYEQYNTVLGKYVCINGYTLNGDRCIQQCSEYEDYIGDNCVCKPNHYYSAPKKCAPCPVNSRPNTERTLCICNEGFISNDNGGCVEKRILPKCLDGMDRLPNGQCVCNGYIDSGRCRPVPKCPIKAKWNQDKLRCECTVVGEYLIDNTCQSCRPNEGWNGKQCACVTGYFKIDGQCRTCHPNSYYNNKQCVCNLGFFGNGKDLCQKCHSSCGRCVGPKEDQCTLCSDVSYSLVIKGNGCGVCSRNSACPLGLYKQKGECRPCSSYCSECISEQVCKTCIPGFQINSMQHEKKTYSYCVQICGDGKRFQLDCDDGNTKNGDGCSSQCQIQQGWHCQGGSTIKPSTCVCYSPSRSFITLTGAVHLFGKVVQGVRLSYIPPALTANDCMDCHKLLWVRVVSSIIVPGVRVNYLPKTQYQFMVQFDFNGVFAIPVFTISVQINPDFAKYFSEADLAQIEVKAIDPSVLAKPDQESELSEDDIDNNQIQQILFKQ